VSANVIHFSIKKDFRKKKMHLILSKNTNPVRYLIFLKNFIIQLLKHIVKLWPYSAEKPKK